MKHGKIFFISGPSGVGKGTLIRIFKEKFQEDFVFPPSCTTRDPRPGEVDGETYYFITKEEFEKRIENDEFLEYAQVHNGNYYGTLKEKLVKPALQGKNVIREFDVQGFTQARERLDRDLYTSIFFMPDFDLSILIKRIKGRAPMTDEEVEQRHESMKKELAKSDIYDHLLYTTDQDIPGNVVKLENIIFNEIIDHEEKREKKRLCID